MWLERLGVTKNNIKKVKDIQITYKPTGRSIMVNDIQLGSFLCALIELPKCKCPVCEVYGNHVDCLC